MKKNLVDSLLKICRVIKDVFSQSKDGLPVKLEFLLAFFIHYFSKFFLKHPRCEFFPKLHINLFGCLFETRKHTIDFWTVLKSYEKETTKYLLKKKRTGVFIDVGAHIGRYSILMAHKGWIVYSFEPLQDTYQQLLYNIKLNNLSKNIHVFNFALGSKNFSTWMYVDLYRTAEASLSFSFASNKVRVRVRKLDDALRRKFRRPVVMKIDVEGYEYEVLRGSIGFIKRNKPEIIIEVWDKNKDKVYRLLSDLGYVKDGKRWVYKNNFY